MSKTSVITARVSEELSADLDKLAAALERSRAWVVAKAIERYVAEESEFIAFIQEGEAAIDRGDVYTHEEVVAWFLARHGDLSGLTDQAAE